MHPWILVAGCVFAMVTAFTLFYKSIAATEWMGVKWYDDFQQLPEMVNFHSAFAYAAYETPSMDEKCHLFARLRRYRRIRNEKHYSVFAFEEERYGMAPAGYPTHIVSIRGTDPRNLWDLTDDVFIALLNETLREGELFQELVDYLRSLQIRPYTKVNFTGHSLGATVSTLLFQGMKTRQLDEILGENYAFCPGFSPTPTGHERWRCVLNDPAQHLIAIKKDVVSMSLVRLLKNHEDLRANIHLISGLRFGAGCGVCGFIANCFRAGANKLPIKIQVHDIPVLFTTAEREQALTRPQLNLYLYLERLMDEHPVTPLLRLTTGEQQKIILDLLSEQKTKSSWCRQYFEPQSRQEMSSEDEDKLFRIVDERMNWLLTIPNRRTTRRG